MLKNLVVTRIFLLSSLKLTEYAYMKYLRQTLEEPNNLCPETEAQCGP